MTGEKKKGRLSKMFGAKKSGCCGLKIEEMIEEQKKEADAKTMLPGNIGETEFEAEGCCSPRGGCCGPAISVPISRDNARKTFEKK